MKLPPSEREIIPPVDGWESETCYAVEVAVTANNIVHQSIFYSGFLKDGQPAAYNLIMNPTYEHEYPSIENVHYLRVLHKLDVSI